MTNLIIAMAMTAIISVESDNGADLRTGDRGKAVGVYQMWPVAVREANRIESIMARREGRRPRKWTLSDRHCRERSRQMCETTMKWHYRRGVKCPVELACKWRNPYSACPEWYRRKIRKAVRL